MGLSISVSSASSEALDSKLSHAITALAVVLARKQQQGELPTGPSLDVTFMLPGKLEKPTFSGMRMGGYTEQDNTLYFERAVPDELLQSPQAGKFVTLVLEDAIDNATDYFADRNRLFNCSGWKSALEQVGVPQ